MKRVGNEVVSRQWNLLPHRGVLQTAVAVATPWSPGGSSIRGFVAF